MSNPFWRKPEGGGLCLKAAAEALVGWYSRARRDLPWRNDPSPYRVWISEIMLQQTRVETVIPYYDRFLARFPDVEALARAPLDDVLACWSGLGYYRRARSLHAAARLVVDEHGGEFPRDFATALSIPGIGRYTAGAILSIAYGELVPVVDGNVERVLTRLLRLPGNPKTGRTAAVVRGVAAAWIPEGRASDFNQALMELGATICAPLTPRCDDCPVKAGCQARRHGDPHRFPRGARPRASVSVSLDAAVVRRGDEVLLETSRDPGLLEGIWLFPLVAVTSGGKRAAPEGQACRARELESALSSRLGVELGATRILGTVRHSITYRRMTIRVVELEAVERGGLDRLGQLPPGLRWSRLDALGDRVAVSSLVLKIATTIAAEATRRRTKRAGTAGP